MFSIKKNQQGISILMTVLILSSLMILTLTVSDVVFRVGKSTDAIGKSEVAYFAAESAVEKALYEIEKNYTINGLNVSTPQNMSATEATWTRTVAQNNSFSVLCSTLGSNEGLCINNSGAISASNPLFVKLEAGHSFQMDLRFAGLELPNTLHITWSGGTGKIIVASDSGQTTYSSSPFNTGDLESSVRIINTSASLLTFEVKPANGSLAVGIVVTGTGVYKGETRVLEVEKKIWQIY